MYDSDALHRVVEHVRLLSPVFMDNALTSLDRPSTSKSLRRSRPSNGELSCHCVDPRRDRADDPTQIVLDDVGPLSLARLELYTGRASLLSVKLSMAVAKRASESLKL